MKGNVPRVLWTVKSLSKAFSDKLAHAFDRMSNKEGLVGGPTNA
jgi:hypothetical protein